MHKRIKELIFIPIISFIFIQTANADFVDVIKRSLFFDPIEYFSTSLPIIDQNFDEFRPLDNATKAEFYKLLVSSTGYIPEEVNPENVPYSDIHADEWFTPYILEALNNGLLTFSEENPNFDPGGTITRYDAAKEAFRYYGIVVSAPDDSTTNYIDIDQSDKYAALAQTAYEMELFSDHKSRHFYPEKPINRAETTHMLYQIHQLNPDPFITGIVPNDEVSAQTKKIR